jgi:hypothetical protein
VPAGRVRAGGEEEPGCGPGGVDRKNRARPARWGGLRGSRGADVGGCFAVGSGGLGELAGDEFGGVAHVVGFGQDADVELGQAGAQRVRRGSPDASTRRTRGQRWATASMSSRPFMPGML